MNIWSVILSPDFLFTSIRVMTPILFAAMACMVFVKGGIDPIGTEGIMLSCALAGPVGGYFTHSALGGVIFAMAVGVVLAFRVWLLYADPEYKPGARRNRPEYLIRRSHGLYDLLSDRK